MTFTGSTLAGRAAGEGYGLATLSAVLLAILAARLAVLAFARLDLAYDEAQYWLWSEELAAGYYSKPPLIAFLIRAATELCGDGIACVRSPAPVSHVLAAFAVYGIGRRLYDARVGFWSAVTYAVMPGVAVSSLLVTTDAPLLLCWTAALALLLAQIERPRVATALGLGLAVGLGLNAKYAMIYIVMCAALYFAFTPGMRAALRAPSTWLALAVALLSLVPNFVWNAENGFQTLVHTGDNIDYARYTLDPLLALEFLAGQFAIPGPIVLGTAFAVLATGRRTERPSADRFLLFFSMPIIALISVEALLGESHGNWAATAYPAIIVLATAHLLARRTRRLFAASMGINVAASVLVAAGALLASHPLVAGAYASGKRLVGWPDLAAKVEAAAKAEGIGVVVGYGKPIVSELGYYLRDSGLRVLAYKAPGSAPADHFEMTRPWHESAGGGRPVLLVLPTAGWPVRDIDMSVLKPLAEIETAIYLAKDRRLRLYRIDPQ